VALSAALRVGMSWTVMSGSVYTKDAKGAKLSWHLAIVAILV